MLELRCGFIFSFNYYLSSHRYGMTLGSLGWLLCHSLCFEFLLPAVFYRSRSLYIVCEVTNSVRCGQMIIWRSDYIRHVTSLTMRAEGKRGVRACECCRDPKAKRC